MRCDACGISIVSLASGLLATGGLFLAVVTDFWLYTGEAITGTWTNPFNTSETIVFKTVVESHSGLWRACTFVMDQPSQCTNIGYFQTWERVDGGDTTNSIMRAIRKSSPVMVVSLLLLIVALGLSTVGNTKKDIKTLIGAVFYIFSALLLAIGVIFYISAVNDEVSHRKKPDNPEDPQFSYKYGWAFFFAGSSFMSSMVAAVANIALYVRRFPNLEDMASIVPGLEKKSNFDFSSTTSKLDEHDLDTGAQNPTIIL